MAILNSTGNWDTNGSFNRGVLAMGHRYADLLFSDPVKAVQRVENSRKIFQQWESKDDFNHRLGDISHWTW